MAQSTPPAARRHRNSLAAGSPGMADTDPLPPGSPEEGLENSADLGSWEEDEKIRDILRNEENTGAKLEIYVKGVSGKWDYLYMLPLEEWTPESRQAIADKYGGGDYKARVRKAGGAFGMSFQFSIARSVKPVSEPGRPSELLEIVKLQKNQGGDMLPILLQMMQQQQAQMMAQQQQTTQLLVAALQRPGAPAPSDKIMEVLLTKAMTPAPALDLGKIVATLRELKELANSDRRGGGNREGGGGVPRNDGFWDALMAQLPSLLGMVMQAGITSPGAGQPPAAPGVPQLPPPSAQPLSVAAPLEVAPSAAPAAPATPPPAATPEQQRADQNRQALHALMDSMTKQAAAGADPLAVAVQLSESLDDENFAALAVVLQREDWLALLADAHDGVMMQSPWLIRWRERLLAELEEPPEAAEAPPEQPPRSQMG